MLFDDTMKWSVQCSLGTAQALSMHLLRHTHTHTIVLCTNEIYSQSVLWSEVDSLMHSPNIQICQKYNYQANDKRQCRHRTAAPKLFHKVEYIYGRWMHRKSSHLIFIGVERARHNKRDDKHFGCSLHEQSLTSWIFNFSVVVVVVVRWKWCDCQRKNRYTCIHTEFLFLEIVHTHTPHASNSICLSARQSHTIWMEARQRKE